MGKMTRHSTLNRFARAEAGSLTAETVLVLPLLIWAFAALYGYWDIYRAQNSVQKASHTLSDLLSREMAPIDGGYLDGMETVLGYLVQRNDPIALRVTSIVWTELVGFSVLWSHSTDPVQLPALGAGGVADLSTRIPIMADGDSVVLVETRLAYTPPFNLGVGDTVFEEFIVTRPRFVPKVEMAVLLPEAPAGDTPPPPTDETGPTAGQTGVD
jgi:hypothetical protein